MSDCHNSTLFVIIRDFYGKCKKNVLSKPQSSFGILPKKLVEFDKKSWNKRLHFRIRYIIISVYSWGVREALIFEPTLLKRDSYIVVRMSSLHLHLHSASEQRGRQNGNCGCPPSFR